MLHATGGLFTTTHYRIAIIHTQMDRSFRYVDAALIERGRTLPGSSLADCAA